MLLWLRNSTGQNLYFHLNHPIKWVRLVGLIVGFEVITNRFILILDDCSGATIEATCVRKVPGTSLTNYGVGATYRRDQTEKVDDDEGNGDTKAPKAMIRIDMRGVTATGREVDLQEIDIGSVVKVKGGIGKFRGQRQIDLERVSVVRSTAEEATAWTENLKFRQDVLDRPWAVAEEEVEGAKRELDGLDREKELMQRRKRRRMMKREKDAWKSAMRSGPMNAANGTVLGEGQLTRAAKEQKWRQETDSSTIEGLERRNREDLVMQRIEQEDIQWRKQEQAAKALRKEQDDIRKGKSERERKEHEDRQRLVADRRRQTEAKERILREMGAGR